MLRPSYTDLLEVINKDGDDNSVVASRYSIVIAASKRARQLVDDAEPLVPVNRDNKPVSIAVNELYAGKIKIIEDGEIVCGEEYEAMIEKQEEEKAAAEAAKKEEAETEPTEE